MMPNDSVYRIFMKLNSTNKDTSRLFAFKLNGAYRLAESELADTILRSRTDDMHQYAEAKILEEKDGVSTLIDKLVRYFVWRDNDVEIRTA